MTSAKRKPRLLVTTVVIGACIGTSPGARSQAIPDAGQILREQPTPKAPKDTRAQPIEIEPPAAGAADVGPRVRVKAVRIAGAMLVPDAELQAQVADLVGTDAGLRQLQLAALRLSALYLDRGYLARVILPEQDLSAGVVEFRVIEGRRGAVTVDRQGERIDAARVRAFVDRRLAQGAPMDMDALGEALNIVNEQPGADVAASLLAGTEEGTVDLLLTARDRPLMAAVVGTNNHASRGVGTAQAFGTAAWDNPTGRFDAASVLLNASQGSVYVRGDYGVPVGNSGARVRAYAGVLSYRLVQDQFRSLEAKGGAVSLGLASSYPLLRRSSQSLAASGSFEHKRLVDETTAGQTGRRLLNVASVGINGDMTTGGLGGASGELSYGAILIAGDVDQKNAAALAADQAGRRTQGSFAKLSLSLGWKQQIASGLLLSLVGRGQWAGSNLDSSEQFFLGGPNAVRAYPVGEAVGDEGWALSADLSRRISDQVIVGAFVDGGEITLNHTTPALAAGARNRYGLAGAGVTLDWQVQPRTVLRVQLATPLGNNPAAQVTGNDADGRKSGGVRAWAGLTAQF